MELINELKALAEKKGDKLEIVANDRIYTMRDELDKFRNKTELNGFQHFIFDKLYNYDFGKNNKMTRRSVIIIAIPFHAAYANITFNRNGREYKVYGLVSAPISRTGKYITDAVRKAGHEIKYDGFLPLKRLAVQSGLAEYGKNNITYVKGFGSYLSYTAYTTDIPCEKDNWRSVTVSPVCKDCDICLNNCPTGAIMKDRFLLNNKKCLTAMNEDTRDFPLWLPDSAHHTPYGCLKCQIRCPLNAESCQVIDVSFSEEETERLLDGKPYNDAPEELKRKINILRLDSWASIPRNMRALFNAMDNGHIPSL